MPAQLSSPPKLPKMELIPPKGAEVEGVFRSPGSPHNGRIIYIETVLDIEATKASAKVKKDDQGNEVWKKHPTTGEPMYPIMVKETKWKDVRYILTANDVGRHVKRNTHFEPTAEELAELKRREEERDFLKDFVAEAVAQGLSPAQVVAKVKADVLNEGEDPESVEIDLTEDAVAQAAAEAEGLSEGLMSRPDDDPETLTGPEKSEEKAEKGQRSKKAKKGKRKKKT